MLQIGCPTHISSEPNWLPSQGEVEKNIDFITIL